MSSSEDIYIGDYDEEDMSNTFAMGIYREANKIPRYSNPCDYNVYSDDEMYCETDASTYSALNSDDDIWEVRHKHVLKDIEQRFDTEKIYIENNCTRAIKNRYGLRDKMNYSLFINVIPRVVQYARWPFTNEEKKYIELYKTFSSSLEFSNPYNISIRNHGTAFQGDVYVFKSRMANYTSLRSSFKTHPSTRCIYQYYKKINCNFKRCICIACCVKIFDYIAKEDYRSIHCRTTLHEENMIDLIKDYCTATCHKYIINDLCFLIYKYLGMYY